jgi:opacity protein-like surface antigen
MKRLLIGALAALALGLAAAAPAYADEDGFLTELANDGWSGPADVAVALGNQICSDVADGVPEATTLQTISDSTTDGVEPKDAKFFYDAASAHLC